MIWDLKSRHSDKGFDTKAGNFMISDKNEQFSDRNWCKMIVKNSQRMIQITRHFRRNFRASDSEYEIVKK